MSAIPLSVLMCHAPIVIPEVAGRRASSCVSTTAAMVEAGRTVMSAAPDVLVVLSPHTPRRRDAWGIVDGDTIEGTFARFGVPDVGLALPRATDASERIARVAKGAGLRVQSLPSSPLDHGALVPLHFVVEAGWRGPTVVIAFPADIEPRECARMGEAIARAAADSGQRWVLLASGDMSHRLLPDAPAGFHPQARAFDDAVQRSVAAGDYAGAVSIDPELRDLAAEDVIDSLEVAAAAIEWNARGHKFLSYEGPFGVGYLVAVLHRDDETRAVDIGSHLCGIARSAIDAHLRGRAFPKVESGTPSRGVFVTLWGPSSDPSIRRELRGCVGHIEPLHHALEQEVAECAVASATRDVRMDPVDRSELSSLAIEVKVLGPLELVATKRELDPHRFGVLVTQGARRGVLLPKVEGVDTVEQQLAIACRKGGIDMRVPFQMHRFTAQTYDEGGLAS